MRSSLSFEYHNSFSHNMFIMFYTTYPSVLLYYTRDLIHTQPELVPIFYYRDKTRVHMFYFLINVWQRYRHDRCINIGIVFFPLRVLKLLFLRQLFNEKCCLRVRACSFRLFLRWKYVLFTPFFTHLIPFKLIFFLGSHSGTGITPLKWTVEKEQSIYYLCTCKQTKCPPICDGSHTDAPLQVKERQENCARNEGHVTDCKLCTKCGWVPEF